MNDDLPIIDFIMAKNVSGSVENAKHLLSMLTKNLKEELIEINQLYQLKDFESLQLRLHKLRGALSYCGVPRLKYVVDLLDSKVRTNAESDLSQLLMQLECEADSLLQYYPATKPHWD